MKDVRFVVLQCHINHLIEYFSEEDLKVGSDEIRFRWKKNL